MVDKLKMERLQRVDIETFKKVDKIPVIILLDSIRSMNNVGSIFRTADAFIIEKIVLCGITPQPPHREIHKVALGATESVKWSYEKDITKALQKLKSKGYKIVAIEQTTGGMLLDKKIISKYDKYVLIMGNEVDGVSKEALDLSDDFIEIPQFGTKHSLNVSVCAGIIMWEFLKKMKL